MGPSWYGRDNSKSLTHSLEPLWHHCPEYLNWIQYPKPQVASASTFSPVSCLSLYSDLRTHSWVCHQEVSKPLSWVLLYPWREILTTVPESSACFPVHLILPSRQVLVYLARCLQESALTLETRNHFQSCAEGCSRKSHSSGARASTRHNSFLSFRGNLWFPRKFLACCQPAGLLNIAFFEKLSGYLWERRRFRLLGGQEGKELFQL